MKLRIFYEEPARRTISSADRQRSRHAPYLVARYRGCIGYVFQEGYAVHKQVVVGHMLGNVVFLETQSPSTDRVILREVETVGYHVEFSDDELTAIDRFAVDSAINLWG